MSARTAMGALVALSGAVAAVAAAPSTPAPSTPPAAAAGLYSAADAVAGAELYAERCAMCHGRTLEGTHEVPGLTGKFVANWAGRPVGDLAAYVGRAIPQFAPGSLTPEETGRLVAFVLKANGYPAAAATAGQGAMALPPPPPPR